MMPTQCEMAKTGNSSVVFASIPSQDGKTRRCAPAGTQEASVSSNATTRSATSIQKKYQLKRTKNTRLNWER